MYGFAQVSCLDLAVTSQCVYNDQTEFVGGDLPEVRGGRADCCCCC